MKNKLDIFGFIDGYLSQLKETLDRLDRAEIFEVMNALSDVRDRDGIVYVFGNGGSLATASHLACDLGQGACPEGAKPIRVVVLGESLAMTTACANDLSYSDIFVAPLRRMLRPGDLALGISGSGNSPNVLKAIEYANSCGCTTIGFTGYQGGKLKSLAKLTINAKIDDMQLSEDVHLILNHLLMRLLKPR